MVKPNIRLSYHHFAVILDGNDNTERIGPWYELPVARPVEPHIVLSAPEKPHTDGRPTYTLHFSYPFAHRHEAALKELAEKHGIKLHVLQSISIEVCKRFYGGRVCPEGRKIRHRLSEDALAALQQHGLATRPTNIARDDRSASLLPTLQSSRGNIASDAVESASDKRDQEDVKNVD
ncbi:MAG: hypothetical protein JSR78_16710 [Proteobacteria bacterium]|nr:hypothetical protein [Pseudomonadota bacterium]